MLKYIKHVVAYVIQDLIKQNAIIVGNEIKKRVTCNEQGQVHHVLFGVFWSHGCEKVKDKLGLVYHGLAKQNTDTVMLFYQYLTSKEKNKQINMTLTYIAD